MIRIGPYRPDQFAGVDALWREAFPDDPPRNRAEISIPAKRAVQPELLLVATDHDDVVGSVMAGYDGHRGWIYSLAVRSTHRGRGLGASLIGEAEARLKGLGCLKVNLQVRVANQAVVGFYSDLGYRIEDRISMGKALDG
ncbi:GNAT family acetyltransferase [Sphingosinicella terrae]|uniref:GNAT family acetyltransferase n=1 Tax=Sphingosinicella terrae TaxID=2172047 RepID=UPI000E0DB1EE|nr:GNAT family acetyltransferase [Sphingosinicella terrae]